MAVSKKNKNRANVGNKEYLWWVYDETDQTAFDGVQVKIVCSDQSHTLHYGLQQFDVDRAVILSLKVGVKWIVLACPKIENTDGIITRSGIVRLVNWCKNKEHNIFNGFARKENIFEAEQKQVLLEEIQPILD